MRFGTLATVVAVSSASLGASAVALAKRQDDQDEYWQSRPSRGDGWAAERDYRPNPTPVPQGRASSNWYPNPAAASVPAAPAPAPAPYQPAVATAVDTGSNTPSPNRRVWEEPVVTYDNDDDSLPRRYSDNQQDEDAPVWIPRREQYDPSDDWEEGQVDDDSLPNDAEMLAAILPFATPITAALAATTARPTAAHVASTLPDGKTTTIQVADPQITASPTANTTALKQSSTDDEAPISTEFPTCFNGQPFCLPANNSALYVDKTYYVTWDANFFPVNSSVIISVEWSNDSSVEAWHSDIIDNAWGYAPIKMEKDWLQGYNMYNLTFYL